MKKKDLLGIMSFADEKYVLWQTASEWSDTDRDMTSNSENSRDLTLLNHFLSDIPLTNEEYAHLAERGYIVGGGGHWTQSILLLVRLAAC